MLKEITRNDLLKILRKHETRFSKHPNSNNVITLPRKEWNEDAECPEEYNVDIRFTYPNYIYLISELYGVDNGVIKDGGLGVDVFSLVPRMKTLIKQLEEDGYLIIGKQKCTFYSEKEEQITQYDELDDDVIAEYQIHTGKSYKRFAPTEAAFLKTELAALNSTIVLTTKGQGCYPYMKERIYSEPIGFVSFLISLGAVVASLFLK